MKIIADTHVHTIASEHAFSTVMEIHAAAKEKGLRFLAVTDHTGKMPGTPPLLLTTYKHRAHLNGMRPAFG